MLHIKTWLTISAIWKSKCWYHPSGIINTRMLYRNPKVTYNIIRAQWENTFNTNIHPFFYLSKYSLPHMKRGSTVINCASVNNYIGRPDLLDYTSTKGAIVAFTRGLSNQQLKNGIRVNCVCPGPGMNQAIVWSQLIMLTTSSQSGLLSFRQQWRSLQWNNLALCQWAVEDSPVKLLPASSFSPAKTAASSLVNVCTRMVALWLTDN